LRPVIACEASLDAGLPPGRLERLCDARPCVSSQNWRPWRPRRWRSRRT